MSASGRILDDVRRTRRKMRFLGASGQLTGRDAWYVFDDRMPFVLEFKTGKEGTTATQEEFLKKQSEAIKDARLLGVRPMAIGQLLTYLGYDYHAPVTGRGVAQVTDRLERKLGDVREELDQVVNRVTATALKHKAAQLGQIKEITEDAQSGSLTIVVEV